LPQIPDDVRARLLREYPGETHFEAIRLVESLQCTARVLRSIIYLAKGDFEQLVRFARASEIDWRDVVYLGGVRGLPGRRAASRALDGRAASMIS
jgi:hypothetical protein